MSTGKKHLLVLALSICGASCSDGSSTSAVELRTVVVDSSGSGNCDAAVPDAPPAADAPAADAPAADAPAADAPAADAPVGNPCTFTQGYWKNHPGAWPVTSLTLGGVTYTPAQLLAILHAPVKGNGLIALAHQLIAAKLNIANGANGSSISDEIFAADALIDGRVIPPIGTGYLQPSTTSDLVHALDEFNNSSDCD